MTKDETSVLSVFIGEFREFRTDDRAWKENIEPRLRNVETFITAERAKDKDASARGISRRSYVASAIAAVGVTVSIILGVVNFVS